MRKVNPSKRKANKDAAKERLAQQASLMMNHPTECCMCNTPFERTHETVKSWFVTVVQEKKRVHLTCPECWKVVEGVVDGN